MDLSLEGARQSSRRTDRREKKQRTPTKKTKQSGALLLTSPPQQSKPFFYNTLSTPCRQIAQLQLKSSTKKQPKLLGSKSLSQLIPRKLFFSKNWLSREQEEREQEPDRKLASVNSFPNAAFIHMPEAANVCSPSTVSNHSIGTVLSAPEMSNRVNSMSLIALATQSPAKFSPIIPDQSGAIDLTISKANFSPIVASRARVGLSSTLMQQFSSISTRGTPSEPSNASPEKNDQDTGDHRADAKTKSKLKSTAIVLRDVKNSIGLRLRAKHESRSFAKLTEEPATPTPVKQKAPQQQLTAKASKAKAKGNSILRSVAAKDPKRTHKWTEVRETKEVEGKRDKSLDDLASTPKGRIALQHKRHLMQANKFAFDSPTGRLRETVKEVEQLQQCIEDISEAIRARSK